MYDDIDIKTSLDNYIASDSQIIRLLNKIDDLNTSVTKWKSIASDLYETCLQSTHSNKTNSMLLYEEAIRESNTTN